MLIFYILKCIHPLPPSHYSRDFPEHNAYTTPVFFSSDWLNEYWDTLEVDDYRFVYMGPKGSWYEDVTRIQTRATVSFSIITDIFCQ